MPFSPNIPSNEGKSIRERHFFFYTSNKESKLIQHQTSKYQLLTYTQIQNSRTPHTFFYKILK